MEPGQVRVMEPVLATAVPERSNYVYQVKWDGVRMLAFIRHGEVILQNKGGKLKTTAFPELNCLGNIAPQPAILDGELVAIRNGRPDFSLILRRNFSLKARPGAPPVAYVIFDILCLEGRDLRPQSLKSRQEALASLELPQGPISVIDNFSDGRKLFVLTGEKGWEGIVAKDLASPYRPGKSPYWQKIKHRQKGRFWIIGYTSNQGKLASLLLGYDFGGGIEFAGAAASGLSQSGTKMLQELLQPLVIPQAAVQTPAKLKTSHWVRPLLQVEVEYMEWTESLTVRAPVLKTLVLEEKEFVLP